MINKVTLIGHVGQDPEVRRLENGTPVGRFSLATSESYKDAAGELQTQTEWHNIVIWRQQAELAERLLKKGALVYVEGKISYRKFTDKNGVERTSTDITASTFRLMGKKEGGGGNSNFPSQEPASPYTGQVSKNEPVFEVVAPSSDAPAPDDDLPF
jgi:single-strand DNA-binding protein